MFFLHKLSSQCKMLTEENVLSKTITFLRFPLIVAVVIIHTNLTDVMIGGSLLVNGSDFPVYNVLRHVLTNELARIAVPLFYFISGFLFFYRTEFTKTTYLKKIGKRVRPIFYAFLLSLYCSCNVSAISFAKISILKRCSANWRAFLPIS